MSTKIDDFIKKVESTAEEDLFTPRTFYSLSSSMFHEMCELLKEQEAVKPRVTSAEQRCGNCNKVIEKDGWKSCPWCGKPIAWSKWWDENGEKEMTWDECNNL